MHQSQSLQSSFPCHTLRNKQIHTCSGMSWTMILPAVQSHSVHLNWLLCINKTERVRTVLVWGDPDTEGQQTEIGICGFGFTINNVRHTFSQTLPSRLLCVWNVKNGLLSQKCPQAGSVCKQKNTFLLVEKGTTPASHKIIWQNTWFGC